MPVCYLRYLAQGKARQGGARRSKARVGNLRLFSHRWSFCVNRRRRNVNRSQQTDWEVRLYVHRFRQRADMEGCVRVLASCLTSGTDYSHGQACSTEAHRARDELFHKVQLSLIPGTRGNSTTDMMGNNRRNPSLLLAPCHLPMLLLVFSEYCCDYRYTIAGIKSSRCTRTSCLYHTCSTDIIRTACCRYEYRVCFCTSKVPVGPEPRAIPRTRTNINKTQVLVQPYAIIGLSFEQWIDRW